MQVIAENKDNAIQDTYEGSCKVCGLKSVFHRTQKSLRESYGCEHCGASLRYRGQAELIIDLYNREESTSLKDLALEEYFSKLEIFEVGVSGPFRKYLESLKSYHKSFYWDDVAPGTYFDGVRCENLEQMTFADDSFDVVISSDIMEHVRRPFDAFKDIHRVLKCGGWHVFSIPIQIPMNPKSKIRVDTKTAKDILLDEAHYHGNGVGGKSLVYIDYGADIVEQLMQIGYSVQVGTPTDMNSEAKRLITFATQKR